MSPRGWRRGSARRRIPGIASEPEVLGRGEHDAVAVALDRAAVDLDGRLGEPEPAVTRHAEPDRLSRWVPLARMHTARCRPMAVVQATLVVLSTGASIWRTTAGSHATIPCT